MNGGGGIDFAYYNGSREAVSIDLAAKTGSGGQAEGDTFFGGEGIVASAFDDELLGTGADNYLAGCDGDDLIKGRNGEDTLAGGGGADKVVGGNGDDILSGDTLGPSTTTIGGNETFWAEAADNLKDILIGGAGEDMFVLAEGGGDDVIKDFEPGVGRIDFAIATAEDAFDPLASAEQKGDDVVIEHGADDSVRLKDVSLAALSSEDFDMVTDPIGIFVG